jgi:hypothetical protein
MSGSFPRSQQLVAPLLLALMAVGSFLLWTLIPAGTLWLLAQVTDSATVHYLGALAAIPAAMILFASLLARLNGAYLIVTGADRAGLEEGEDVDARRRRMRGPIEPLLFGSFLVAVVALGIWWLTFDHVPPLVYW